MLPKWPEPINWKEAFAKLENEEPGETEAERGYKTKQLFELSFKEVAKEMDIPERTAINTAYRGLKHFRVNLLIYNILKRYAAVEPVTDDLMERVAQEVAQIIQDGRVDEVLSQQY
jgi:hypothetical protein